MNTQNNSGFSDSDMQKLLGIASSKLGISPEKLKEQAENGQIEQALGNLSSGQANQLKQLMNNPQAINMLLKSPQAQAVIRNLM
ncbi:MAG: hypothetical protein RSB96_01375, partial [Oscillospiraceae bacterium]